MNNTVNIPASQLPKLRILVVDDNKTNLQMLLVFLKKLGHQTISAENGEEAVQFSAAQKPDLILLDIMMPVMDGFEAARQIRAQASDRWVPIIFLSALDRNENLVSGLDAGGDDFMSKPINFVVLEAKVVSMQRMLLLQRNAIETLKRIQVISDNVIDAIVTTNTQATIISCNSACERIFGWSIQEMIGQNITVLMPDAVSAASDQGLTQKNTSNSTEMVGIVREASATRKDGSLFPVELGVTQVDFDDEHLFISIIRDISERKQSEAKLRENAALLQRYYDETERESQLARSLIDQQLLRASLKDSKIHYWLTPAKHFSGDAVAVARSPQGKLYALLADATGHGLTAAISTLPVLTIFYSMVANNPLLSDVIGEINRQLKQAMPIGRFVAATFVCIDYANKSGEIWVGGTPESLLIGAEGALTHSFLSTQLPLGILDTEDDIVKTTLFSWTNDCQLLIYSDGVLEAENRHEVQFGHDRLMMALGKTPAATRHDAVRNALSLHLDGLSAHDDISLLLIDCSSE
ncbi:MAG: SpoIIE family protein phosphatase [Pseudomonadota bacterium]